MAVGDKKVLVTQDFVDLTYDKKSDATDDLNTYDSSKRASAKAIANLNDRVDTLEESIQSLSGGGSAYVLPVATDTILGGIKVGSGLTITNGVLSTAGGGSTQIKYRYQAIADQTTFLADYNIGFIDVYLNGIKLDDLEFTADNGINIILNQSCFDGDIININCNFNIPPQTPIDSYTKLESDAIIGNINSVLDQINGVII